MRMTNKFNHRNIIKRGLYSLLTAVVSLSVILPTPISAMSNEQLNVYKNSIYYFNVEEDATCGASTAGAGGTALTGSDNEAKAFNYFVQKGLTPSQSAGIIGNMMVESPGVNPAAQQDGSNTPYPKNGVGFGISQWTFTPRQQPLVDLAAKEKLPVNTLAPQLDYVWQELHTTYSSVFTDLKAASTVDQATSVIMYKYESPAGSPSELLVNLANRTAKAKEALSRYGSTTTVISATNNPGTTCTGGSGAVTGNIVQTALNYAWDTKGHGPLESDAKPSYQTAMPKYNGSTGSLPYSDCGVFVATVVIATGADPNFVKRGTKAQMDYMASNPSKWQEIPNVTSTAPLLPGDILVSDNHTYIYVGKQSNGYNSVAASLNTHVPQPDNWYPGFRAFRLVSTSPKGGA